MMNRLTKTASLSLLLGSMTLLGALDDSFGANRANVWITEGESSRSFYIPQAWSANATLSSGSVLVDGETLSSGASDEMSVYLNLMPSSYPSYSTLKLPSLSLVGLDAAQWSKGDGLGEAALEVTPFGGVFENTTRVSISLNATGETTKEVEFQVDGGVVQNATLSTLEGEKSSLSFYLSRAGEHHLTYRIAGEGLKSLVFTIENSDALRDSDGDGIPDNVEVELGLNPLTKNITTDGWSKFDTIVRGEDINDTDGDGWSDFDEKYFRFTDPNDAAYKPTVTSLYGVEYNLSSELDLNATSLARVSVTDLSSGVLYDTKKVFQLRQTGSYINKSISEVFDENLTQHLESAQIPLLRIPAEIGSVVRVQETLAVDANISKHYIPSSDDLTLERYYEHLQTLGLSDINATEFIDGFKTYMSANLLVEKSVTLSEASSLSVAYLEAVLKEGSQSERDIIVGDPDVHIDFMAFVKRNVNALVLDLEAIFSTYPLETTGLEAILLSGEKNSEVRLASFLQNELLEIDRYKIALMALLSFEESELRKVDDIYNVNADSDGDGILNGDELFASSESSNPLLADSDGDGVEDDLDVCVNSTQNSCLNSTVVDSDGDGVYDGADNCPFSVNSDQNDSDFDGIGDICAQKGVSMLSPRVNIELFEGDSYSFEATRLDGGSEIFWFVDGASQVAEQNSGLNYSFNEVTNHKVCASKTAALVSAEASCIVVNVLAFGSENSLTLHTLDVVEGNDSNPVVMVSMEFLNALRREHSYTYETQSSSAIEGEDFVATSGSVNFSKGDKRYFFDVPVLADTLYESDETFLVSIYDESGSEVATSRVSIYNDDLVTDTNASAQNSFSEKYFYAFDDGEHGREPWYVEESSGVSANLLSDMVNGGSSSPHSFTQVGDTVYFVAKDFNGVVGLYATDTDAKIPELLESFSDADSLSELNAIDGKLYFLVRQNGVVDALYMSDGSSVSFVSNIADDYVPNSSDKKKLLVSGLKLYVISQALVGGELREDLYLYDTRDGSYTLFKDMPDEEKAIDNLVATEDGFYFSFGSDTLYYSDKQDVEVLESFVETDSINEIVKVGNLLFVVSEKFNGEYRLSVTNRVTDAQYEKLYGEPIELYGTATKAYLLHNLSHLYELGFDTQTSRIDVGNNIVDDVKVLNAKLYMTTREALYREDGTQLLEFNTQQNIRLLENHLGDSLFVEINNPSAGNGDGYRIEMIDVITGVSTLLVEKNVAPTFTSPDSVSVTENQTTVLTVTTD
ncbi:MAG: Calx-beta domain-containing protein, partial [Campylobacterota bacterium]|nr:Calx-beta domain-containing protein [Campylobacterota bacterium]